VFGPSTTQVDPDVPYRESRQASHWHHTEDPEPLRLLFCKLLIWSLIFSSINFSFSLSRIVIFID